MFYVPPIGIKGIAFFSLFWWNVPFRCYCCCCLLHFVSFGRDVCSEHDGNALTFLGPINAESRIPAHIFRRVYTTCSMHCVANQTDIQANVWYTCQKWVRNSSDFHLSGEHTNRCAVRHHKGHKMWIQHSFQRPHDRSPCNPHLNFSQSIRQIAEASQFNTAARLPSHPSTHSARRASSFYRYFLWNQHCAAATQTCHAKNPITQNKYLIRI